MIMTKITVDDISGLMAIVPTPAKKNATDPTATSTVDLDEAARAVEALVSDGVDAIMTNGTFGEGATLTWDEHHDFARTVIDVVAGRVPVYIGATTLNTRDTIARSKTFADLGANGLLLGRPMWSPLDDDSTVDYFRAVADAVPSLAIVAYDNPIAFRGKLSPKVYAGLAKIPQVVAAKYPNLAGSFLADLAAADGKLKLLPVEREWYYAWAWEPEQITACWSGSASCGPHTALALSERIQQGDAVGARQISMEMREASSTFFPQGSFELFSQYNVQLEKIRINEAGYMNAGPSRPPYVNCPDEYAQGARESGRRLAVLNKKYQLEREQIGGDFS